jgi:Ca2+-binding RTX toxin-like protein
MGTAATFQVQVHAGAGNDRLRAYGIQATAFHLGLVSLLDLGLYGGAGNDTVQVLFADNPGGTVSFTAPATFRLRLGGGAGRDTVEADLSTAAAQPGVYDVQVRGGSGNDVMGLSIVDPVFCLYHGGAALLDGGLGINTLDPAIPLPAANVRRVNV